MKCEEVMEYMQRCLDMDLTDAESAAMQEHMKTCTSRAEMFERLNHLSDELVNLPKVVPPYSIVDSILPKLDEIDEQATKVTSQPESISKWREFRKSVSLRVLGGMAAAVVFVVIAVNQFPQFVGEDGTGNIALFNSTDSGDDSGADMDTASENSIMMDTTSTADQRSASFTLKSEEEAAPAPEALPPASDAREGAPPAADAPEGGATEGGYGITAVPEDEAPADSAEAAVPEEPAMDAPIMKDGLRPSLTMEFADSMSQIVTEPIVSPDGTYTAWGEQSDRGYQVVIADQASGDRLYASPVKQADSIQELTWSESEAKLTYKAVTGESSTQFTIDVELREESPSEN